MKLVRSILSITLCLSLTSITTLSAIAQSSSIQDSNAALQRGYRTGYSDGYMSGYRDSIDNAAKNVRGHREYTEAQRAYSKEYGALNDYRDGYRQGFEIGYETGFDKRSFESAVPLDLARRGLDNIEIARETSTPKQIETQVAQTPVAEPAAEPQIVSEPTAEIDDTPTAPATLPDTEVAQTTPPQIAESAKPQDPIRNASYVNDTEAIIIIPKDTELIIEIQEPLSTERNVVGDKFTAKIVSPYELEGAMIEGRIERITQPGRIKRRSEMLLAFDRVVLSEDRWSNFSAILTEVMPVKGDNVRTVDNEGSAIGKRSMKEDSIKIGAATGAGLGIGALTAGPVGAAVGAGVGAAFGVGAVVIERGKHIKLNGNQQLRIKTNFETRIR